jgi:hypothetical protein
MAPFAVQDEIGDDRGGDLRPASIVRTDRLSVLVDMDRDPRRQERPGHAIPHPHGRASAGGG